jgi:multiple sugar transport system permease protein
VKTDLNPPENVDRTSYWDDGAFLRPIPVRRRRSWAPPRLQPYLMVGPAFMLMITFVVLPTVLVIALAFFRVDLLRGDVSFVGWGNVRVLLVGDELTLGLRNTLLYTLMTAPISVTAGLLVALGINALDGGRSLWRAIFFLPYASTLVAMAAVWRWIFFPNTGLVDSTVGAWLGLTNWLSSFTLALPAVAIVGNWHLLGFVVVVFLAGLTGVPRHLQEAARLDGAGSWSRFWHVTWPALGPATVFAVVISTINSLKTFETIKVMTDGGPVHHTATLTFLLSRRGTEFNDIGGAAVLTIALLLLVVVVDVWQVRTFGRRLDRAGAR